MNKLKWESVIGIGMSGHHRAALVLLALSVLLPATAPGQLTVEAYSGTNNGLWNIAANWSPANVPDIAGEMGVLTNGTAGTPVTVLLNTSPSAIGGFWQGANNTLTRSSTADQTLTLSAGANTAFTNAGAIASGSSTVASGTLTFKYTNGTYRNSGSLLASSNTTLTLDLATGASGCTIDNTGGAIVATNSGVFKFNNAVNVTGGRVGVAAGGTNALAAGPTFSGVALTVASGGTLLKSGSSVATWTNSAVTNSGRARITTAGGNGRIVLANGSAMTNGGTIEVAIDSGNTGGGSAFYVQNGATLCNGGSLIVTNERTSGGNPGTASIELFNVVLTNNGTIVLAGANVYTSNDVNQTQYATGSTLLRPQGSGTNWLDGAGTLYMTPGTGAVSGTARIETFNVTGGDCLLLVNGTNHTIVARGGGVSMIQGVAGKALGTLRNYGALVSDGSLGGGLNLMPNVSFQNYGTMIVTNAGSLNLLTNIGVNASFSQLGAMAVTAGSTLSNAMVFTQAAGTSRVDGVLTSTRAFNMTGGWLTGIGTVQASVIVSNGATLAPGYPTGTLNVTNAALTITNGTLAIKLNNMTSFSKLIVSGTGAGLNLAGNSDILDVSFVDKPHWNGTTTFRIFEGSTLSGTFEIQRWAGGANNNNYTVTYGANYIDINVRGNSLGMAVLVK